MTYANDKIELRLDNQELRQELATVCGVISAAGGRALVVGGCVRDAVLWKSACKRDPRREVKIGIENGPTAVISVG
jgi:hypothetical protein